MIVLTPRQYGQTMSWSLVPANKIDTFTAAPLLNTIADDPSNFDTLAVTANLLAQDESNIVEFCNRKATNFHTISNRSFSNLWWQEDMAKGRVDVLMLSGTATKELQVSVEGIPSISLELLGVSKVYPKNGGNFNAYPTVAQMHDRDWSLANWIRERATQSQPYLNWIYEGGRVNTHPFVKNFIPAGQARGTQYTMTIEGLPMYNDVWTSWMVAEPSSDHSGYPDLNSYDVRITGGSTEGNTGRMWPPNPQDWPSSVLGGNRYAPENQQMTYTANTISFSAWVEKTGRYRYTVHYNVPIRVAYASAARGFGFFGSEIQAENFAFCDMVKQINLNFVGRPYNTEETIVGYSLDAQKNLTEDVRNQAPYKVPKGEVITIGSTIDGKPWHTEMAKKILTGLEKGKYLVFVDVPAKWAIEQGVTIDTRMSVTLQNGDYITRKGVNCIFEVKNIIKKFSSGAFMFSLGLMEV